MDYLFTIDPEGYKAKDVVIKEGIQVNITKTSVAEEMKVEYGYNPRLIQLKNKIDGIDPQVWKKVRWFVNPYDFIVGKQIINRAFYKYWEMLSKFSIMTINTKKVLHLAEAPGGFIQATNHLFESKRTTRSTSLLGEDGFITKTKRIRWTKPKIFTMSLNKKHAVYKDYNLPSYNSDVIEGNVQVTYGADNTGNLCNQENLMHLLNIATEKDNQKFDLITADGGFDEGTDFNNKEQLHYILFLGEMLYPIVMLKEGGDFVIKMFDTFTQTSIHILYLMHVMFDEVHVYKPKTSRPTNSEKYLICKGLRLSPIQRETLYGVFKKMFNEVLTTHTGYISFEIFEEIPERFTSEVKRMNSKFTKYQCDHLDKAIGAGCDQKMLMEFDVNKVNILKDRVSKFENWKLEHGLLD